MSVFSTQFYSKLRPELKKVSSTFFLLFINSLKHLSHKKIIYLWERILSSRALAKTSAKKFFIGFPRKEEEMLKKLCINVKKKHGKNFDNYFINNFIKDFHTSLYMYIVYLSCDHHNDKLINLYCTCHKFIRTYLNN